MGRDRTEKKILISKIYDVDLLERLVEKLTEVKEDEDSWEEKMHHLICYGTEQEAQLAAWVLVNKPKNSEISNLEYYISDIKRELAARFRKGNGLDKYAAKNFKIEEILRRYGIEVKNGLCLCPFHGEKTASFSIRKSTNTWKCFGCGLGGDGITLVMRLENVSFHEAIEKLT